jgi:ABC-type transport system involved in cytochrome bd biosynthesis fused ATPase/permease subunit
MTRVEGVTTFVVHAILAGSTCAILLLTIQHARSGRLTPGAVFTILAYILLMHNKTVGLGRSVVRAGRVLPSAERIASALRPRPASRKSAEPKVDLGREPRQHETRT